MSKLREEAINQTKEWLQRNKHLQVIEESHKSAYYEYFIKDEEGYVLQVYLSANVQKVNELGGQNI